MTTMKTKTKHPIPLIHPAPICLIGTMVQGHPNYTTIGDVAVAGIKPALIMISINIKHACMEFINQTKTFSINIPTKEQVHKVDYAGMHSGHTVNKSTLFESEMINNVPIIKNCPINLIVEEVKRVQVEHRTILVCSVKETYLDKNLQVNGTIDLSQVSSILYGLNNRYYTIGGGIGTGYQIGTTLTNS